MVMLGLLLFAGYLLGSIPTSVLVSKRVAGIDIREHGSGNAGGTNVLRVVGWKAALVVAVVDVGKGSLAALLPSMIARGVPFSAPAAATACGLAAVIGHVYPVFASFRGGKGVGTSAGAMIVVQPLAAACCAPVFAAVLLFSRMVSLSSMSAALALPLAVWLTRGSSWISEEPFAFGALAALALFILFTHRANLARILRGSESRIGKGFRRGA
jgi:glycerol-3-phosphate acyltransferase PlsY